MEEEEEQEETIRKGRQKGISEDIAEGSYFMVKISYHTNKMGGRDEEEVKYK